MVGLTLATQPEDVYRALLEATAFGTRMIVETFATAACRSSEFVVAGGLPKNPLLMQIYADVTRLPLSVIGSEQGPALGSAIHAAVAAGAYPDVAGRREAHGQGRAARRTCPTRHGPQAYDALFAEYLALHDHFGRGDDDDAPAHGDPPRRRRAPVDETERVMTAVADVSRGHRRAAPRGLRAARAS